MITMEKIVSLCKRRGFVYPSSEIYGGLANAYDYGPLGTELKRNIKKEWLVGLCGSAGDDVFDAFYEFGDFKGFGDEFFDSWFGHE